MSRHTGWEELDVRKNIPWVLSAASVSQHCRSRPSAAGDHRHKQLPRHSACPRLDALQVTISS